MTYVGHRRRRRLPSESDRRRATGRRHAAATCVAAYVGLTKPRVIELLLLTTVPVMFFAARRRPRPRAGGRHRRRRHALGRLGHALNCVYDRDIDEQMRRTRRRALPRHIVTPRGRAGLRARARRARRRVILVRLGQLALGRRWRWPPTCFYVFGYTMLLKRRTTQNIVWGGLAGCFPALIGWTAVTGQLAWAPVVLFARRLLLDAAAHLGAGAALPRGLRRRRRADAAGGRAGAEVVAARSSSTAG